jgi:hypothetical protein
MSHKHSGATMAGYVFASAVQPTVSELVVRGVSRSDIVCERGVEGIGRACAGIRRPAGG